MATACPALRPPSNAIDLQVPCLTRGHSAPAPRQATTSFGGGERNRGSNPSYCGVVINRPNLNSGQRSGAASAGSERFAAFIGPATTTLRRAFVARHGIADGSDAAAEAIAWAWEHREQVEAMSNPLGYLYRVGQSSLDRDHRLRRLRVDFFPEPISHDDPHFDEELFDALIQLAPDQRTALVMVHMYSFSYREVAELMNASEAAVTNYVHRGLKRLRQLMDLKGGSR